MINSFTFEVQGDEADMTPTVTGLRADLRSYLSETPRGLVLSHPLLRQCNVSDVEAGWITEMVDARVRQLALVAGLGDVYQWVMLHQGRFRLDAFSRVAAQLADAEYWNMVKDLWLIDDHIPEDHARWHSLLAADRPGRSAMMREEEMEILGGLEPRVRVWRGYQSAEAANGFDWVVDVEVAARLWPATEVSILASAEVDRGSIIALLRSSSPPATVVLIDPATVRNRRDITPCSPARGLKRESLSGSIQCWQARGSEDSSRYVSRALATRAARGTSSASHTFVRTFQVGFRRPRSRSFR